MPTYTVCDPHGRVHTIEADSAEKVQADDGSETLRLTQDGDLVAEYKEWKYFNKTVE